MIVMNVKTKNYLKRTFFITLTLILFSQSPLFKINKILLHESHNYNNEKIKQKINYYLDKNIFLTFFKLKRSTLATHIQNFRISLSLPATLHLSITEKSPWMAIKHHQNSFFISQDGYLLRNIINTDPLSKLPIILQTNTTIIEANKIINEDLQILKEIHHSCQTYFPEQTWLIEKNNAHTWTLYLNDIIVIKLEHKLNQIQKQLKRLQKLFYEQKIKNNVRYIDLRIPKKVIIKYEQKNSPVN